MPRRPALKPEDMLTPEQMATLSGREMLEKTLTGEVAAPPISHTLNFGLHAVGDGEATFRGTPQFASFNPAGTAHGGWFGAILDSAMACAIWTKCAPGQAFTTLEYKVNITRVVPEGMEVEVIARTTHFGHKTAVSDAIMRGVEDGKVYATGSTTCIAIGV